MRCEEEVVAEGQRAAILRRRAVLVRANNGVKPEVALGQAVSQFRVRELGDNPQWVEFGDGVGNSNGAAHRHGLRVIVGQGCRPGHILVGRDD